MKFKHKLSICADDFGITKNVNSAIIKPEKIIVVMIIISFIIFINHLSLERFTYFLLQPLR